MRVGMVGLGKLGLPVAYAMGSRGLNVYGYDPVVSRPPEDTSHEDGLAEAIEQAGDRMVFCGLLDVVNNADVVFVATQTPHGPEYEGVTPLPETRADFDYSFLVQACKQICRAAEALNKRVTLSVISTVLPGTMRRYIEPLLPESVSLVYSPSFIAMGTTIQDFLDPEFVLLGSEDATGWLAVAPVYRQVGIHQSSLYTTSVENAELIKVAYNTFIGLKIAFANTLMEVCHKTGCDVDEVTGALKLAHRRLISPAYMDGGMGDGGACHPRDNIALSWLARELGLSHDLFEDVMVCREDQARWLADLMCEYDLPKGLLGTAYKPGSAIETGSAALLVADLLKERGEEVQVFDPFVERLFTARPGQRLKAGHVPAQFDEPAVYLVGCKHPDFPLLALPAGSVVIDPFRYIPDQEGVTVVRLGGGTDLRRGSQVQRQDDVPSQDGACSPRALAPRS